VSWHVSDNPFVNWIGDPGENPFEDWIPEGFIGRLPIRDVRDLQHMVAKILGYEMTPDTGAAWVEGAVLIAAGVHSCFQVNEAIRDLMLEYGYQVDDIHEAYADYPTQPTHNVISDGVDEGVGFVNFRGYDNWGGYTVGQISERENGWRMPVVTGMVCGTNDFTDQWMGVVECIGEAWVRGWNGDEPCGGVACFGPTDDYTHTMFNNSLDANFYNILLNKDVHTLGALCVGSKMTLLRNFPSELKLGDGTTAGYYFYTYTLLGDPSLQVWTKDPEPINADFEANLPRGANLINVTVTDDAGDPLPGAYVHIYRDGSHFGGFSGPDGTLSLTVAPLEEGAYLLTVTAANRVPILDTITVTAPQLFPSLVQTSISDDTDGISSGNNDGNVNPDETVELFTSIMNSGTEDLGNFSARIETKSPWIEIMRSDADFGALAADSTELGDAPFIVHVLPATPDSTFIEFDLIAQQGQTEWRSGLPLMVNGYKFLSHGVEFPDGELEPGTEREMVIAVQNIGLLDATPLLANLQSDNREIQIRRPDAAYGEIPIGESRDNTDSPFLLRAGPNSNLGAEIHFTLTLSDQSGRVGVVNFTRRLGEPVTTSPQGPDKYGYYVFDAADSASGMNPEYEWADGEDRLNGLQDNDDRINPTGTHGDQTYLNLPFEFTYYGQLYSEITVGSNGWLAFGHFEHVAWHNEAIGSPLAPGAMLCPYWNDLWQGYVYTRYDQDNARFIVEWRDWAFESGNATFEVILYDPTVYATATGDGEIVFQYQSIPEPRDYAEEKATIGFCSPDRSDGIQVGFGGNYSPNTIPPWDNSVLRISTGEITTLGSISGRVSAVADGTPMQGVTVMIDGTGFFANTSANGDYLIERIPIGTYSLTAHVRHFNDAFIADIQVHENETAQADFALTYPTFNADIDHILFGLQPGKEDSVSFTVRNDGNGPLDYKSRINLDVEGADWGVAWDSLFEFNATDASGNNLLQGIAYDGDSLFIDAWKTRGESSNMIYVFDREGTMVRSFEQYKYDSTFTRGYAGMCWSGNNLLVTEKKRILEITRDGELQQVIEVQSGDNLRAIAYAPERGTIFTKSPLGPKFLELSMDGVQVGSYSTDPVIQSFGLAWYPEDPDGYKLYIFAKSSEENPPTQLRLYKLNPETGDILHVRDFYFLGDDAPVGCAITSFWNPKKWALILLISGAEDDRVMVYELSPNTTWLTLDPLSGSVPSGEIQPFSVGFSSMYLPEGEYDLELQILHNADGDRWDIPIQYVVAQDWSLPREPSAIREFGMQSAAPNPFNAATRIGFALTNTGPVEITIWDLSGRLVDRLDLGRLEAGNHSVLWNGSGRPSGLYLAKLKAKDLTATQKLVLIR